jgi:hypothetical protein
MLLINYVRIPPSLVITWESEGALSDSVTWLYGLVVTQDGRNSSSSKTLSCRRQILVI